MAGPRVGTDTLYLRCSLAQVDVALTSVYEALMQWETQRLHQHAGHHGLVGQALIHLHTVIETVLDEASVWTEEA